MNENYEIALLEGQKEWQAKQNLCGVLALGLCITTVFAFIFFVNAPSAATMILLLSLMFLLLLSCASMIACAAKVVEIRSTHQALKPTNYWRHDAQVIDVEVI